MATHATSKKQDQWDSEKVKELLRLPENKKCFDCPTKSPCFVNITIHTFVCLRCSGLVREVGHRVKSISASKFSAPEIISLEHGGNKVAQTIWLGNYNMKTAEPELDEDVRFFMRQKYYELKWVDRETGASHGQQVRRIIKELCNQDGTRKSPSPLVAKRRQCLSVSTDETKMVPTQSWVDDNVPIGLIPTVQTHTTTTATNILSNNGLMLSPMSPAIPFPPQPSKSSSTRAPLISAPQQLQQKPAETKKPDFFSELTPLNIIRPITTTVTCTGGILKPNSPSSSTPLNTKINTFTSTNTNTTFQQIPTPTSPTQHKINSNRGSNDFDPYAALRDLSIGTKPVTPPPMLKMESDDSLSFGDFQKSPAFTETTSTTTTPLSSRALFDDLDSFFKR